MKFTSNLFFKVLALTVVTLGAVGLAHAGAGPNVDVTGTWTWTGGAFGGFGGGGGGRGGRAGGGRGGFAAGTNTLVLKADVTTGVVTGTLTVPAFAGGRGRRGAPADDANPPPAPAPVPIANGKIAGNELTFEVTRPARGGGADTTTSYKVTISADGKTITGTSVTPVAFTATKE